MTLYHFATFDVPRTLDNQEIERFLNMLFDLCEAHRILPEDCPAVTFWVFSPGENHTVILLYLFSLPKNSVDSSDSSRDNRDNATESVVDDAPTAFDPKALQDASEKSAGEDGSNETDPSA